MDALQHHFDAGDSEQVAAAAPDLLARCRAAGGGENRAWKAEKLGLLATGRLGLGQQAADELARLAAAYPGKVQAELSMQVAIEVLEAGALLETVTVLHAANQAWPDKAEIFTPCIEDCTRRAQAAGAAGAAALEQLRQLGYLQ